MAQKLLEMKLQFPQNLDSVQECFTELQEELKQFQTQGGIILQQFLEVVAIKTQSSNTTTAESQPDEISKEELLLEAPKVAVKLKKKQTMSSTFVKVEKKKIKKTFAIKLITAISDNLW